MKQVTVTDNHFDEMEEVYEPWYNCPSCKQQGCLVYWFEYCPHCGVKLVWKIKKDE